MPRSHFPSKLRRRTKSAVRALKETYDYQRHFQASYVSQFRGLRRLYVKDNFTSVEISTLGIANPRIPLAEIQQHISKHDLLEIQYSLNDAHYISLTEDKAIFYGLCDSLERNERTGSARSDKVFTHQNDWMGYCHHSKWPLDN